jgi:hypothetical protein
VILTMISIDVISCDTETCGLHLLGCERYIRNPSTRKSKYSPKARALHRTFFYLQTMHASMTFHINDRPMSNSLLGSKEEAKQGRSDHSAHGARNDPDLLAGHDVLRIYIWCATKHALIIYFSQHVRLMHHYHLRPYVRSVFSHLEASEHFTEECEVYAGPVFWSAFIAASEACDLDLQTRAIAWFERAKKYGLQAAYCGFDLIIRLVPTARSCWVHADMRASMSCLLRPISVLVRCTSEEVTCRKRPPMTTTEKKRKRENNCILRFLQDRRMLLALTSRLAICRYYYSSYLSTSLFS